MTDDDRSMTGHDVSQKCTFSARLRTTTPSPESLQNAFRFLVAHETNGRTVAVANAAKIPASRTPGAEGNIDRPSEKAFMMRTRKHARGRPASTFGTTTRHLDVDSVTEIAASDKENNRAIVPPLKRQKRMA